jgi:hypothetical protein
MKKARASMTEFINNDQSKSNILSALGDVLAKAEAEKAGKVKQDGPAEMKEEVEEEL